METGFTQEKYLSQTLTEKLNHALKIMLENEMFSSNQDSSALKRT